MPTSTLKIFNKSTSKKKNLGFTLIEVMIVLALLGGLISVVISKITRPNTNPKQFIRSLTVLSREVRNQAKLKFATYRIVFEFNEKENGLYWVEVAQQKVPLSEEDIKKELEKVRSDETDDDEEENKSPFQPDTKIIKEKKEFPKALKIKQIETATMSDPIREGRAFIHFFPEGLVEGAAIQVTDSQKLNWTLYIHPITGKMEIIQEHKSLRDIRQ